MKQLKLVALLFAVTNSGCAYLDARSSNVPEKIDALVAEQQYGRAQAILVRVAESHADYARLSLLHEETVKQAMLYEQQALVAAKNLEQQGDWYQAKKYYQQALSNLPESEKLQAAQQALRLKQVVKVAALEFDLLVAQGEWLRRKLAIQQALFPLTPGSWFKTNRYEALRKNVRQLAGELSRRGKLELELELEQGSLVRADHALNLALALHPSTEIEAALKVLALKRETLANEWRQSRQADTQKRQQAIIKSRMHMRGKLQDALALALDKNRLSESLNIVTQLKLLGELSAEEKQRIQQLKLLISKQVEKEINLGIKRYGQGQYKQAIFSWRNALALEPGNEQAVAHIERAERILEKLQRLREEKIE